MQEESKIPASAAKISPFSTNKEPANSGVANPEEFKPGESPESLKKKTKGRKSPVKGGDKKGSSNETLTVENQDKAQDILRAVSLNDTLLNNSDPAAAAAS